MADTLNTLLDKQHKNPNEAVISNETVKNLIGKDNFHIQSYEMSIGEPANITISNGVTTINTNSQALNKAFNTVELTASIDSLNKEALNKIFGNNSITPVYPVDSCCDSSSITTNTTTTPYSNYLGSHTVFGQNNYLRCDSVIGNADSLREQLNKLQKQVDGLNNETRKENEKNMKFMNYNIGPCDNNTVHMSMYGLAIKNKAGNWVSYKADTNEIIDVDVFNFEAGKLFYRMPVPIKDIKVGDVIAHNHLPMFVTKVTDINTFIVIDPIAGEMKEIMPSKSMFGYSFIIKIMSVVDFGSANADSPFGNMLIPMMLSNNGDIDPMMFLLMNQNNMADMNPMMMYALMSKDGGKSTDIWPLLFMMSQSSNNNCNCHCNQNNA